MNREQWLMALADELRPAFHEIGSDVPGKVRLTCGWPSKKALSMRSRTIGECWIPEASADKTAEIFISPCLGDALSAAETLTHELIHATGARGHRGDFSKIAKSIGFTKPWRSTPSTPELKVRLNALIVKVGPYPHAALDLTMRPTKKDGIRMLKVVCPECGYVVRTTAKWIDVGLPVCPCGSRMERI